MAYSEMLFHYGRFARLIHSFGKKKKHRRSTIIFLTSISNIHQLRFGKRKREMAAPVFHLGRCCKKLQSPKSVADLSIFYLVDNNQSVEQI